VTPTAYTPRYREAVVLDVPEDAAEAAAPVACPVFRCTLPGRACAARHLSGVAGHPSHAACAACPGGRARAALLDVRAPTPAEVLRELRQLRQPGTANPMTEVFMNDAIDKVLAALAKGPRSAAEVRQATVLGESVVKDALHQLKRLGRVALEGAGRSARWSLAPAAVATPTPPAVDVVPVVEEREPSRAHVVADRDAARREAESAKALQAEAEREAAAWRERCTTNETVGRHEWSAVAKALHIDPATLTAGEVCEAIEGLAKDADIARQWRAAVDKMRAGMVTAEIEAAPSWTPPQDSLERRCRTLIGRVLVAIGREHLLIEGPVGIDALVAEVELVLAELRQEAANARHQRDTALGLRETYNIPNDYRAALAHMGRAFEAVGKGLAAMNGGGNHE
jgi:hypothetical protein